MASPRNYAQGDYDNVILRKILQNQTDVINGVLAFATTGGGGTSAVNLTQVAGSAIVLGQAAAASSLPVTLSNENVQDQYATGQATQTAVVNNIIPAASGTNATDTTGYRSAAIQVVSTGTGGTFIFEGSNDNVNFQAIPVYNQNILTGTPIVAAITASASQFIYTMPLTFRYLRLRIATLITGGSIQAFSILNQSSWTPGIFQVAQVTAANLNATVTGTITAVTTVTTLANGQTAHSSASTGSPVRIGGRVNTTLDTTLVQGDASDLFVTTAGQLVEKPYSTAENDWTATSGTTPLATNTSTALKAAGGASIRNYCTALQLYNSSATVSTTVSILDGVTVIWTGYLPATTAALAVVPIHVVFPTPLKGSAATALNIQCGTTGSSVFYNAEGYQSF